MHDYKIMVIDDDDIIQFTTKMMLKYVINDIDNNVLGYTMPTLALEYLQTNQNNKSMMPDLILLDINMPIMDGFEFMDFMMKTVTNNIPVIFMVSSSLSKDDVDRSFTYTMVKEYLSKPLMMDAIRDGLEKHLK